MLVSTSIHEFGTRRPTTGDSMLRRRDQRAPGYLRCQYRPRHINKQPIIKHPPSGKCSLHHLHTNRPCFAHSPLRGALHKGHRRQATPNSRRGFIGNTQAAATDLPGGKPTSTTTNAKHSSRQWAKALPKETMVIFDRRCNKTGASGGWGADERSGRKTKQKIKQNNRVVRCGVERCAAWLY